SLRALRQYLAGRGDRERAAVEDDEAAGATALDAVGVDLRGDRDGEPPQPGGAPRTVLRRVAVDVVAGGDGALRFDVDRTAATAAPAGVDRTKRERGGGAHERVAATAVLALAGHEECA